MVAEDSERIAAQDSAVALGRAVNHLLGLQVTAPLSRSPPAETAESAADASFIQVP